MSMDVNTCFATTASIRDLALYAHLIPASAVILLSVFVLWKAVNRFKAWTFASFCATFALWLFSDLVLWTSNNYHLVAALWAPIDFVEIVFFLLLLEFVCIDLFPEGRPRWVSSFILISAAIPLAITLLGQSVHGLNHAVCEMINNDFIQTYKLSLEMFVLGVILYFGTQRILTQHDRQERTRIALVVAAVVLFLGIFAGSEFYASYTYIYEVELYSFFTLPIFVLLLTIAVTSYGTFKLGDAAVKTLFYIFLLLAATQFFFVQTVTDFLLAGMSFTVVLTLGIMLFRLSEREITQRHLIEKQEQELEVINAQQINLLHFISHEIKGYLTKSEAGFAAITEGDYGVVPEQLKTMARSALADVRKGVSTVMDILSASNLKKGTVTFKKVAFDFRLAVETIVKEQRVPAREKNLTIDVQMAEGKYRMEGDEEKIREHVIRNLIDNAIRYTPTGAIHVQLSDGDGKIHFSVKDSGVGITPEDMGHLFTEGGHGKDSIKVNVHSTGYGLFIAKEVVEAEGGKIWAESEGAGKGSRFIVELPAL